LGSWLGVGGDGEVDDRGRVVDHAVPVRGGMAGDDAVRAAPEPCGADAGLGGVAVTADEVYAGVEAGPAALLDASLHGVRGHPGGRGLGEGDHTGLAGDHAFEGHDLHRPIPPAHRVADLRNSAAMIDACGT
jgi:hypothetical protein